VAQSRARQENIAFSLVAPASVELHIYDIRGRLMRTLQPGLLPQGEHTRWCGRRSNAAPGSQRRVSVPDAPTGASPVRER
jgi:hypothetical protein